MQEENPRTYLSALCHRTRALKHERLFLLSEFIAGRLSQEEARVQMACVAEAIGETAAAAVDVINVYAWSLGTRLYEWHDTLPRA